MNWSALSKILSTEHGLDFKIESASPVGGGDIHQAFRLRTLDDSYFLKVNRSEALPLFKTEAHSLETLLATGVVEAPKPLAYGIAEDKAFLLMTYLQMGFQGDDKQRGKDLALIHHQIQQNKQFGWFEDNYIGHTLQKNAWHADWIDFYRDARLLPQLELAATQGASSELITSGAQLAEELPKFFQDYQPEASLLHGDLWGGNSSFLATGEAVFFDPASYYGDRETDLAMTELFGGFSKAFYDGYNEIFPINNGYAMRKPLYQLYHQLNHFNLFGGHYQQQSLHTIESLLKTQPGSF